jgi:hypothetical protein
VVPSTQNQAAPQVSVGPATYGVLLSTAIDLTCRAQSRSLGPFDDARRAVDAVVDYERFLAVSGHHLQLLLSPPLATATRSGELQRRLATGLAALSLERRRDNPWASAGDALALAHDLLATHVGPRGELRTSEAGIRLLTDDGVGRVTFVGVGSGASTGSTPSSGKSH